jgi:hypothetical protein
MTESQFTTLDRNCKGKKKAYSTSAMGEDLERLENAPLIYFLVRTNRSLRKSGFVLLRYTVKEVDK